MAVQVLQRAMQHDVAEAYFNEPVDAEALGIPEYRDIIMVRLESKQLNDRAMPALAHP